jgi:hypothetical protein
MRDPKYNRNINIRLTEAEYQVLVKARKESRVPISKMVRNSLSFYATFYKSKKEKI